MTDGGELDEALDKLLRAMGANLSVYLKPQNSFILDEMRVALREVYDAGKEDGQANMSVVAKAFEVAIDEVREENARWMRRVEDLEAQLTHMRDVL